MGGLRARLLLLVLAPLVPVLVVAFVNARQTREDAHDDARANVRALARLAGTAVDQRLQDAHRLLSALAAEPAVRAGSAACARRLSDQLRRLAAYDNLSLLGPRGRTVCAAHPPAPADTSALDSGWFRRVMHGDSTAEGADLTGVVDPRPAIVVALRLPPAGGRFEGALVAAIDLREVDRVAAAISLPRGAALTVLGPGGEILARYPDPERFVGRSLPRSELVSAARAGATSAELAGLDGVPRIYGIHRVGGARDGILITVGLARAAAESAADEVLRRTLAVLLLVALGATAVVLVAGNLMVARPVRALVSASRRIAGGDLHARSGLPRQRGEIGELTAAFDEMVDTLEARQLDIERATRDRQRLLGDLLAAEQDERKRIAGDIHDDSIQALSALLLRLELLEPRVRDEEARTSLVQARETAREAVARLRHLLFKLTPPALDDRGLAGALEQHLGEIARMDGPSGRVAGALHPEPSPEVAALVYRIAAEAVNNAAKHAGARRIDVALDSPDGGVRVRVSDDGEGFDLAHGARSRPGHLGLSSMRERAEAAGGWWRVDSAPGRGTTVEFFVPEV